jgi:hypothetical protein
MKIYTEVYITPHHSGFGMYQTGELQISPQTSWADFGDLTFEIAQNSDAVLELSEALEDPEFQAAGVEDISGRINNQPDTLFARISDGNLNYFGIVESEVADDFYA